MNFFQSLIPFAAIATSAIAADISYNTGSLGTLGDGTNSALPFGTTDVVLDQPGALTAFGDFSSLYSGGNVTSVPYRPELNPASNLPFTIEFWAHPTSTTNNNAPVACRVSTSPRSGWAFFQRNAATGWNFVMYNGNGSQRGWDLTGGTATLNSWSHVAATWDGSTAKLYVNGAPVTATNAPNGTVAYNASTSAVFTVGNLNDSNSPFNGFLDEVAFYPTALTPTQIASHYTAASSPVAGAYSSMVLADGAVLHLQQNPPFVRIAPGNPSPTITFTGILARSPNLNDWEDLTVTSPYTPPGPLPTKLFFRAHR
jgi:hypothetical protein